MSRRTGRLMASSILVVVGFLFLGWSAPALAGNWAVISLDALPGQVTAGQEFEIGFIVLQHGNQDAPMTGLTPTVKAVPVGGGQSLMFSAREDKTTAGHYLAKLTLPQAGEWSWSVQAFSMDQVMPVLTVAEGAPVAGAPAPSRLPVPMWLGTVGLLGFAAGLGLTIRRRSAWFAALALGGLVCAVLGFGLSVTQTPAQAQEPSAAAALTPASLEQIGHDLFVAKGCVSCHLNARVDAKYFVFSTEIGPNLTDHPLGEEYLHLWLKDPRSAKPDTKMPNLGLKKTEIEALIAFLNESE